MSDENVMLTLEELYKEEQPLLSLLYPELPENYFDDKTDIFVKEKNIIDKYNDAKIKPFIRKIDLNSIGAREDENLAPNSAWQIGINFSF